MKFNFELHWNGWIKGQPIWTCFESILLFTIIKEMLIQFGQSYSKLYWNMKWCLSQIWLLFCDWVQILLFFRHYVLAKFSRYVQSILFYHAKKQEISQKIVKMFFSIQYDLTSWRLTLPAISRAFAISILPFLQAVCKGVFSSLSWVLGPAPKKVKFD